MKILDDENDCTGCAACFNVCPQAAITMRENDEGFKYPVIDTDKCVGCGLCRKACSACVLLNLSDSIFR